MQSLPVQRAAVRRVVLVIFEGVQSLDATGPAEVFASASRLASQPLYEVVLASVGGGWITTSAGYAVQTRALRGLRVGERDTVLVAGGDERAVLDAIGDAALRKWLVRVAPKVERFGSVCSGAFILAMAGLLDGKRAATHWAGCDRLAELKPEVIVDREAIFVEDGHTWTSAGVTTGIDMALAMLERDHGRKLVDEVSARLVLYARRPGFQSQWSAALVAQRGSSDPLGRTLAWARSHLDAELSVESLAKRAGMSVRTLHRRCLESMKTTPAKLVAQLRVERAKTLLSTTAMSTKEVAAHCGLRDGAQLARLCRRALGVAPLEFRARFGAQARSA
ncbi:MAG: DJ-1/PfpI family protein [Polyangiales bacterium]